MRPSTGSSSGRRLVWEALKSANGYFRNRANFWPFSPASAKRRNGRRPPTLNVEFGIAKFNFAPSKFAIRNSKFAIFIMSNLAIKVDNLSKLYKIGARRDRHDTLRDHLMHGIKSLFSRNGYKSAGREQLTGGTAP